ncbi:MAG: FAD-dependent oxidoreductase [Myxococcota bacterium]
MDAIQPAFSKHVINTHIYTHHPMAVAVWGLGRSPLDKGSELLRQESDGLYFAGDYTLNAHSDGAARSGIRVAQQISQALGKRRAPGKP